MDTRLDVDGALPLAHWGLIRAQSGPPSKTPMPTGVVIGVTRSPSQVIFAMLLPALE